MVMTMMVGRYLDAQKHGCTSEDSLGDAPMVSCEQMFEPAAIIPVEPQVPDGVDEAA